MITTLLLVRHGQTDWNNARRWQGHIDIPLNEVGIIQSKRLAERLATLPIAAVYSSDLKRAAQTAAIIADPHEFKPVLLPELRERNGGIFQGLNAEEIGSTYPTAFRKFLENGEAPPEGESNLEVASRIKNAVDQIAASHAGELTAIVSHGGALAIYIAHVMGFPLGTRARISLRGNTGLSIVEIDGQGPRVTLLNDVSHLAQEESSPEAGFSFHQLPIKSMESE